MYLVGFTGACGVGMSDVYYVDIIGDRTGGETPLLNWR